MLRKQMKVIRKIEEMKKERGRLPEPVGFVPTMGFLHEGHLALIKRARGENESVVVSIFVNPLQFGPGEDFDRYPRDINRDLRLLEGEGVDVVFIPSESDMYPPDFCTFVDVRKITERLEGASRPGHFRGVATVLAKLFNIVRPQRAYFGQKDAQQLVVVRRMVRDLNMDVEIVGVPTVREPDGLPASSRNIYLSEEERRAAGVVWKALCRAEELWRRGERRASEIRSGMQEIFDLEPRVLVEYISVADPKTLEELEEIEGPALISLAIRIGRTRLIDNIIVGGGVEDLGHQ